MEALTKICHSVLYFELPTGLNEKLEEVSTESWQAFMQLLVISHSIKKLCLRGSD